MWGQLDLNIGGKRDSPTNSIFWVAFAKVSRLIWAIETYYPTESITKTGLIYQRNVN